MEQKLAAGQLSASHWIRLPTFRFLPPYFFLPAALLAPLASVAAELVLLGPVCLPVAPRASLLRRSS